MKADDLDTFMKQWLLDHGPEELPGAMLMRYGPENYIGAALAVRGTLYFKGAHTPAVRKAICECFDEYEVIAKAHLTWLWLDEPPKGPDRFAYPKAPPLRHMMKALRENDNVGFAYIGGEKPHDASPWVFHVLGMRGWEAKLGGNGLDCLEFSLPAQYVQENPTAFQRLFVAFARRLKAVHGHGGFAFNLSLPRVDENESTEAVMASKMNGIDVGHNVIIARRAKIGITDHIKTVGWLTAINMDMVEKAGGLAVLFMKLPTPWFATYDYGNGVVIQAGPAPQKVDAEVAPKPALYVLPNMALKGIRIPEVQTLHGASHDGEPRLFGWAAEQWIMRFDVPDDEIMTYRAKLAQEPQLTPETVLPNRM